MLPRRRDEMMIAHEEQRAKTKRILVVGAGLAGVTAAAALANRASSVQPNLSCQIDVVDALDSFAMSTSYANAGRFCPTYIALGTPAKPGGIMRTMIPAFVKRNFLPLP